MAWRLLSSLSNELDDLLPALKAGSDRAFAVLVRTLEGPVVRFVLRLVGSAAVAEEIAQETFVQVYRRVGDFREDCKLSSWVYRIALNLAKNNLRARKARPEFSENFEAADGQSQQHDARAGIDAEPERRAEGRDMERAVRDTLAAMPEELRECLILRDLEDLPYDEIGEILGLADGTVKSRISRARQALKEGIAARTGEVIS